MAAYFTKKNFTQFTTQVAPSGAARGVVKRVEISPPSPIQGAHFPSELSNTAAFRRPDSMKINNLQASDGPCRVCKGQF